MLPGYWSASIDASARNFAVSWQRGYPWLSIIRSIGQTAQIDILVDWPERKLVIGLQVRDAWILKTGSLRANLQRWAQQAGWHWQWQVPHHDDLTVAYPTVLPLGMDFPTAIHTVLSSYRRAGVLNLKADLYTHNQLLILRCDRRGC